MDTLHLDQLDELLLKHIVKKFTTREGAKFYRCCRGAKNLKNFYSKTLDKTDWPTLQDNWRPGDFFANMAVERCRLETVFLDECESDFLREVVLPDLAAWGAVGKLYLNDLQSSDEDMRLLLAAAKPTTVYFSDERHDPTSDLFKYIGRDPKIRFPDLKHLHIEISGDNIESFWTTTRVFDLAQNKKTITLFCREFFNRNTCMDICPVFLKNWLAGESTGTLKKLTVIHPVSRCREQDKEALEKEMQELLQNFVITPKGYVVERGFDRLQVCIDFSCPLPEIVFHFS